MTIYTTKQITGTAIPQKTKIFLHLFRLAK